MQKITKENIQDYALKLMFKMKDEEYDSFEEEFSTMLKLMDLIGQIEDIDKVEPMTFPFLNDDVTLREDIATSTLTTQEALQNAKEVIYDEIRVPKVVGGEE